MGIRRIRWLFALLAIPTLTCHALDLNKTVTNRGTEVWGVDELGGSKWALVVEYEDMNLNLTNNSYNKYGYDTNWTLVEVPDFNTKLVVEYEDIPQQNLNFTKNTDGKYDDGNWTLDKVPDFDTRLVVEYEDINFTEDAVGYWTLSEVPDFNIKLVVEYVIKDASSQEWSMKIGPEVNSRLVVEYDDINLNFTEEATGNWTLSEAPDFNTKLVVEYEDENGVEEATMTPSGGRVLGTFTIDGKKLNDASVLKGVVFIKNGKKMLLR